jgi:hypothetical protein
MFTAPQIHAVANYFKKLAEKTGLALGSHTINQTFTIQINGTVNKAADEQYTPTVDIPIKLALALVLEKAGFQRENAKKLLLDAMTEALTLSDKEEELLKDSTSLTPAELAIATRLKDVEKAMEHVKDVTNNLPPKTRKGKTTVSVTIKEIEPKKVEPQIA